MAYEEIIRERTTHLETYRTIYDPAPPSKETFPAITEGEMTLIANLRRLVYGYIPDKLALIDRGIHTALSAHHKKQRLSGGPYSQHLLNPTIWATEMGLDETTLLAIMHHDADEDTPFKNTDIANQYGDEVAQTDEAVTKARGKHSIVDTPYKLVDSLLAYPRAVIVRGLEQEDNGNTLWVHPSQKIDEIYRRTTEFTAPLVYAFGMGVVARRLINQVTAARFPEEVQRLKKFINRENAYDEKDLVDIAEKITMAVFLENPDDISHIDFIDPTLNDLIQTTKGGNKITSENMVLHVDIGYPKDAAMASAYLFRLRQAFGEVYVKTADKEFDLATIDDSRIFPTLLVHAKLDFYQRINNRLIHFRLIPQKQYEFERVSLVPKFRVYPKPTDEELAAADKKLARWKKAWEGRKNSKAKGLSVKEFIRFLQGEGSIKIHTPATKFSAKGHDFELPVGSTVYDLIARLPVRREIRENMFLHVNDVIVTKGNVRLNLHPYQMLPTEAEILIQTGKEVTFNVNAFDYIHTDDTLRKMRQLFNHLIERNPRWRNDAIRRGKDRVFDILHRATGAPKIDIKVERGLFGLRDRYKNDPRLADKHNQDRKAAMVDAFYEDLGKGAISDDIFRNVMKALIKYRDSLLPVAVETIDREGLGGRIGEIMAGLKINYTRSEVEYTGGKVIYTVYIDPGYVKRIPEINEALTKFRQEWEKPVHHNHGQKIGNRKRST